MEVGFAATLAGLGLLGAFVAGLVGVGGAIVMIPLLLYVPPLLGVGGLDIHAVTGVTMVQVVAASLSGVLAHGRQRLVHARLVWVGGAAMSVAAFLGALGSGRLGDRWLLLVFALMATAAAVLMFWPLVVDDPVEDPRVPVSAGRVVLVAGGVGLAAGLVGAGGAFLLVPLLLVVVRVPIRVAIGSSLGIVALGSLAGVVGKGLAGHIPWGPALLVSCGALVGAQVGATVSRRIRGARLKHVLALIVVASALRVWWDFLHR